MSQEDKQSPERSVTVLYFSVLRERRGLDEETLTTRSETCEALYQELNDHYRFNMEIKQLRVAVNDQFVDWQRVLRDGDKVAFLAPVSGG